MIGRSFSLNGKLFERIAVYEWCTLHQTIVYSNVTKRLTTTDRFLHAIQNFDPNGNFIDAFSALSTELLGVTMHACELKQFLQLHHHIIKRNANELAAGSGRGKQRGVMRQRLPAPGQAAVRGRGRLGRV